jgi:methylated-DNA-[protein]-cysteine S-methyltransferase
MGQSRYKTFSSKYGEILIRWKLKNDKPKIHRILLGSGDTAAVDESSGGALEQGCEMVDATIRDMLLYFSGEVVEFDLDTVDLGVCSAFQKKVILAEYEIPRGYISTYKKIAGRIEAPNAARAVGNALAHNPFPIIIPCHRVIRSDGSLGGYRGGIQMKYRLLKMEGIRFDNQKKVLLQHMYYRSAPAATQQSHRSNDYSGSSRLPK